MANAKQSKSSRREAVDAAEPDDLGPDPVVVDNVDPGSAGDAVGADPAPDAADAPVAGKGVADAPVTHRYFTLDGRVTEATEERKAEELLKGGWAEIDVLTYQTILNELEMARLAAVEAKREADRKAAEQKAQDDAAQQPPETTVFEAIAGMKSKTVEERIARIEAILAGMGWAL